MYASIYYKKEDYKYILCPLIISSNLAGGVAVFRSASFSTTTVISAIIQSSRSCSRSRLKRTSSDVACGRNSNCLKDRSTNCRHPMQCRDRSPKLGIQIFQKPRLKHLHDFPISRYWLQFLLQQVVRGSH